MSKSIVKSLSAVIATALCLTVFTVTAKAGGEYFSIYLNNKLILQQVVTSQSFSLKDLKLDASNANDQLVVHYFQCGTIGKERSISLKDSKGKVLKEWKFSNATGSNTGMTIPVKELLQLAKSHPGEPICFYYSSQDHPRVQALASFLIDPTTTALR